MDGNGLPEDEIDILSNDRSEDDKSVYESTAFVSDAAGDSQRSGRAGSPEEKCPICLGQPVENKAYTDSCSHKFCFVCLLEWSKVKAECPLCKQKFRCIIHNVRGTGDYDKYEVPRPAPIQMPLFGGRRFRYPTTMTGERVELLQQIRRLQADQISHLNRNRATAGGDLRVLSAGLSFGAADAAPSGRSIDGSGSSTDWDGGALAQLRLAARISQRDASLARYRNLFMNSENMPREELIGAPDFRRLIYERGLRIRPIEEVEIAEQRIRDVSPQFIRDNPAAIHRLIPFLTRELMVLLDNDAHRVEATTERITNCVRRYEIRGERMRRTLQPVLNERTDHFLHEFYHFARSPHHTLQEHDRRAQYRRPDPDEVQVLEDEPRRAGGPPTDLSLWGIEGDIRRRLHSLQRSFERLRYRMQLNRDRPPPRPGAPDPELVDLTQDAASDGADRRLGRESATPPLVNVTDDGPPFGGATPERRGATPEPRSPIELRSRKRTPLPYYGDGSSTPERRSPVELRSRKRTAFPYYYADSSSDEELAADQPGPSRRAYKKKRRSNRGFQIRRVPTPIAYGELRESQPNSFPHFTNSAPIVGYSEPDSIESPGCDSRTDEVIVDDSSVLNCDNPRPIPLSASPTFSEPVLEEVWDPPYTPDSSLNRTPSLSPSHHNPEPPSNYSPLPTSPDTPKFSPAFHPTSYGEVSPRSPVVISSTRESWTPSNTGVVDTNDSGSEVEVLCELKPRHLRTPPLVVLEEQPRQTNPPHQPNVFDLVKIENRLQSDGSEAGPSGARAEGETEQKVQPECATREPKKHKSKKHKHKHRHSRRRCEKRDDESDSEYERRKHKKRHRKSGKHSKSRDFTSGP